MSDDKAKAERKAMRIRDAASLACALLGGMVPRTEAQHYVFERLKSALNDWEDPPAMEVTKVLPWR